MKRSMKTRLVAIFVVTIVIIIGVISLANVVLLPYFYQSNKVSQMQGVYSRVINICENVDWNKMDSEQKDTIYDKLDQLSSNTNMSIYLVQIRVYQGSGDIAELAYVYPSDSERLQQVTKNQLDKYVKSIYFGQKLDDNCKMITQTANYSMYNVYDTRVDSNFLELTGKMPDNYWIYLRSNYQSIQESASVSNQFMLYVGMIVMIAGVFIMYFVSNQYTKPILRLATHAKNMQKLDFSTRYKDNRDDEIGVLGNSMNALSDRLEKTISELKTANNELQLDLQRRSEQEQMRQEFLANVSHELKTPIALIQGYAEGLQENINDDADILNKCKTLRDYMTFVEKTRYKTDVEDKDVKTAVTEAIDECVEENILVDFFEKHREEVVEVSIYDYDEEEVRMVVARDMAEEMAEEMAVELAEKNELISKIKLVIKKVKKEKSVALIADELEEEESDIKPVYDAVIRSAPEYNVDDIIKELKD